MSTPLVMFLAFIAVTLGITYWAARRSSGSNAYFAAGRRITGWQNGIAVAGDYMSAASFLGIAGIIAFQGYDGFLYSVGWLVAYLTVLLVVAEPLRNAGKYTMADVLAYRLRPRPVRAMAALSTLTVSTFYMIAQMVGAGTLVALLLKGSGISYNWAVTIVGVLMVAYVVFGGMLATTWVQIIKAILLIAGTILVLLSDVEAGDREEAVRGLEAAVVRVHRDSRRDLARPCAERTPETTAGCAGGAGETPASTGLPGLEGESASYRIGGNHERRSIRRRFAPSRGTVQSGRAHHRQSGCTAEARNEGR